jgi:hypothetical protein
MTHKEIEALYGTTVSSKVVMLLISGVLYHRLEDGSWVPYDVAVESV